MIPRSLGPGERPSTQWPGPGYQNPPRGARRHYPRRYRGNSMVVDGAIGARYGPIGHLPIARRFVPPAPPQKSDPTLTRRGPTVPRPRTLAALILVTLGGMDAGPIARAQDLRSLAPRDAVRREGLSPTRSRDGRTLLVARIGPFSRPGTRLSVIDLRDGTTRQVAYEGDDQDPPIAWAFAPPGGGRGPARPRRDDPRPGPGHGTGRAGPP